MGHPHFGSNPEHNTTILIGYDRNCGTQLKTPQWTSCYKSSIATGVPSAQVTGRPPIKLRTLKAPIAITLEVFLEPVNALTPRSLLRAGLKRVRNHTSGEQHR